MPKRWRIATHDSERVAALQQSVGVPAVVAQLLLGRGIDDPDTARHFLEAKLTGLRDPDELPGALQAAQLDHLKKMTEDPDFHFIGGALFAARGRKPR